MHMLANAVPVLLGIAAVIYLEEYAKKKCLTNLLATNINF